MSDGWQRYQLDESETRDDKPGRRWELSPKLDIDAFNLNVAILEPGERLSQNHFHYHENQEELIHVTAGRCRVEVVDDRFVAEQGIRSSSTPASLAHTSSTTRSTRRAGSWPSAGHQRDDTRSNRYRPSRSCSQSANSRAVPGLIRPSREYSIVCQE